MPLKRIGNKLNKKTSQINRSPELSTRIISLRKEFKLSQSELGRNLGVTQGSVQIAEKSNGALLYEATIFFAETYQINPAWVLLLDNKNISKFLDYKVSKITIPPKPLIQDVSNKELAMRIRKDVLLLYKRSIQTENIAVKKKKK